MTSGTAAAGELQSLRDAISGSATTTTPIARAGMSAQMSGRASLTRAVAKRLAPKHTAARRASSEARSGSPEPPPGVMLARTTPDRDQAEHRARADPERLAGRDREHAPRSRPRSS